MCHQPNVVPWPSISGFLKSLALDHISAYNTTMSYSSNNIYMCIKVFFIPISVISPYSSSQLNVLWHNCYFLVCKAQRLDCSNNLIKNISPASCKAIITVDWSCKSPCTFCIISLTTLWKGNLLISSSVPLWYLLISLNAFRPLLCFLYLLLFLLICLSFSSFSLFLHLHFLCPPLILFSYAFSFCLSGGSYYFACHLC